MTSWGGSRPFSLLWNCCSKAAAGPVVAGWLSQVTVLSFQASVIRKACKLRPATAAEANKRS